MNLNKVAVAITRGVCRTTEFFLAASFGGMIAYYAVKYFDDPIASNNIKLWWSIKVGVSIVLILTIIIEGLLIWIEKYNK